MNYNVSPPRFVDARHDITETDKARMKYRELSENKFIRDAKDRKHEFEMSFGNALKGFMILILFATAVVVILIANAS